MGTAWRGTRNRLARPDGARMFESVQSDQIHRMHRRTVAADAVRVRSMPITGIPGLYRKPDPGRRGYFLSSASLLIMYRIALRTSASVRSADPPRGAMPP